MRKNVNERKTLRCNFGTSFSQYEYVDMGVTRFSKIFIIVSDIRQKSYDVNKCLIICQHFNDFQNDLTDIFLLQKTSLIRIAVSSRGFCIPINQ